jgi:hypothetical protein
MTNPIGIADLNLYPSYTRDSFLAAKGVQAPDHDPTKPDKLWAGTGTMPGDLGYYGPAPDFARIALKMTQAEFEGVNIPGFEKYPPWNPAPSGAWYSDGRGASNGATVPAVRLADIRDAYALLLEIEKDTGLTGSLRDASNDNPPFVILYSGGETRRVWVLTFGTQSEEAGQLLALRNSQGAGFPGKWSVTPTAGIAFTFAADRDTLAPVPMPQRMLTATQQFVPGPLGLGWMIVDSSTLPPNDVVDLSGVNAKLDLIIAGLKKSGLLP